MSFLWGSFIRHASYPVLLSSTTASVWCGWPSLTTNIWHDVTDKLDSIYYKCECVLHYIERKTRSLTNFPGKLYLWKEWERDNFWIKTADFCEKIWFKSIYYRRTDTGNSHARYHRHYHSQARLVFKHQQNIWKKLSNIFAEVWL